MFLTRMNQRAIDDLDYRRRLKRNFPDKRAGRPEEVASLAPYLASTDANYVTGTEIVIDGGLSLQRAVGA